MLKPTATRSPPNNQGPHRNHSHVKDKPVQQHKPCQQPDSFPVQPKAPAANQAPPRPQKIKSARQATPNLPPPSIHTAAAKLETTHPPPTQAGSGSGRKMATTTQNQGVDHYRIHFLTESCLQNHLRERAQPDSPMHLRPQTQSKPPRPGPQTTATTTAKAKQASSADSSSSGRAPGERAACRRKVRDGC